MVCDFHDKWHRNNSHIFTSYYCLFSFRPICCRSNQDGGKNTSSCVLRINCCVTFGSVSGSGAPMSSHCWTSVNRNTYNVCKNQLLSYIVCTVKSVAKLKITVTVGLPCDVGGLDLRATIFEQGNAKLPVRMDVWNKQIVRQSSAELQGRLRPS